jgi:exodeoxyribonuclease VII small subunit
MSHSADTPPSPEGDHPITRALERPNGWRYETSVAEVEAIIGRIESGELELEEVFEQFSQAVTVLQQCETFLAEHQAQAELLIETLGDPPSP